MVSYDLGPTAPYPASECRRAIHTGSGKTETGGGAFPSGKGGDPIAIYAPMVYTAPYVMFLMCADPLRG